MKKILISVGIFCIAGLTWFLLQDNELVSSTPNSLSLEVETSQIIDIKKYYNQPISLVKDDWPSTEYSADKKRNILKNDDFSLVVTTKEEGASANYVQAQITRDVVCNAKNATEQMYITLDQVGLADVFKVKPQQENPESKLFCNKNEGYVVNTSCFFDSVTYTVSISEYDEALCS